MKMHKELTSKFKVAETGKNLFLPDWFKPPSAKSSTCLVFLLCHFSVTDVLGGFSR